MVIFLSLGLASNQYFSSFDPPGYAEKIDAVMIEFNSNLKVVKPRKG